jgi:CO/xanthine dehydrogenase Mo-binding subunit
MDSLRVVGKPIPQKDSPKKVRGDADYVGDMNLPGMLHAKVLRSPHPHARILNVDTKRAAGVPGVVAVFAGGDVPEKPWGIVHKDQYVLARDKVRYVGEEVAAVAAESEEAALEALELVEVDYEELPAVFDPEEALGPDAPQINDVKNNLARELHISRGSVDQGFSESAAIHEDCYTTPHQFQTYMEPLAALANVDAQGRVTVYAPTQSIYLTHRYLCEALDLLPERLRVIQPHIGGGFGGKSNEDATAAIATFLALGTGRPVRLLNNRLDEFGASRPRMPTKTYLKMGIRKDGTIAAKEPRIYGNNGACSCLSPEVIQCMALRMDSLYRLENVKTDAYLAYTNLLPAGAFRGFGNVQMAFALESHLDVLAEKLGMDPAELRLRNVIRQGDISIHGWKLESCAIDECIQKAVAAVDWAGLRAGSRNLKGETLRTGVGIACAIHSSSIRQRSASDQPNGWDGSTAVVEVNEEGKVKLVCGEGEIGQGAKTVLAQMTAEELGLEFQDVEVSEADTEFTPFVLGGYASRLTMVAGNAVRKAASACREQLLEIAAEQLEVASEDLVMEGGEFSVKGAPDERITLEEVVKATCSKNGGSAVSVEATWDPPTDLPDLESGYGNITPAASFACVVAVVEVDIETGGVNLKDVIVVDDLGRAINPLTVEGQIHGEMAQGFGFALFEHPVLDGGTFVNGNLADYALPKAEGLPNFTSILIESIDPNGPFGAKGCSECALNACGAVIANAVYNAVGVRIKDLPLTPERILRALRENADLT